MNYGSSSCKPNLVGLATGRTIFFKQCWVAGVRQALSNTGLSLKYRDILLNIRKLDLLEGNTGH
jgi:hypothetical protein